MKILVTGGTGYIGSHTAVGLLDAGHEVVIVDNLSNSFKDSIDGIREITGKEVKLEIGDVKDSGFLNRIFSENKFDGVVHFAASKLVGESVRKPKQYYTNNLNGLLNVLQQMEDHKVKNIVFSSTSAVYGQADILPVTEETPLKQAESPYGNSKKVCEDIIRDVSKVQDIYAVILRYFNVIGAHPSSLLGNNPNSPPESIVPIINEIAAGKRDRLTIYGNSFNTPDGYQIRDYIHVMDLATAHVKALEFANDQNENGYEIFNIGTGKGTSVKEIITAFEQVNGIEINKEVGEPRPGDPEKVWADASKANRILGWKAEKTLEDSLRDDWNWGKRTLLD